ncbi:hypothetical protein CRUP_036178 [Coryphaenoides rupestris]|nr:hypothetical protein CRUP_036178 [Coryphaenoides rupestris]
MAISLERYSAICNPLKSRTWQTKSHAVKVISATWAASLLLMLPYPISSTLKTFTRVNNSTGHKKKKKCPSATGRRRKNETQNKQKAHLGKK